MSLGIVELVVLALCLLLLLLALVGASRMFRKAGYAGPLAVLVLVPIAGWIVLFWFGNADWPVLQRLRGLEEGRAPPRGFGRGPV